MIRSSLIFALFITPAVWAYDKTPDPSWTPTEVVEIVLSGMASNDTPSADAGIKQAFEFASPRNKQATGPLWHFKAIVKQRDYAPLLNHTSRDIGDVVLDGDRASIPLVVVGPSGEVAGFMWTLSKQAEGEFPDSWMTDGVVRVPLGPSMKAL
jgi:hypothetical protein